ncbi:hypothetical protein OIU78_008634 [Salix suchowensis]|nr:hypothetical protein OIU78_008634 [Salix suchowensis]
MEAANALFSIQLPVAVRNSSEYFKDLTVILVSPRFVFVLEKSEKSQETHQYEAECIEKQVTYVEYKVTEDTSTSLKRKKYHRSQSEKLERPDSGRELRRSATDKCRKTIDSGKGSEKSFSPEDKMSNDEFRSTIEAFIARQKRKRRKKLQRETRIFVTVSGGRAELLLTMRGRPGVTNIVGSTTIAVWRRSGVVRRWRKESVVVGGRQ